MFAKGYSSTSRKSIDNGQENKRKHLEMIHSLTQGMEVIQTFIKIYMNFYFRLKLKSHKQIEKSMNSLILESSTIM